MDIEKSIYQLEKLLVQYEDAYEPEEKLDLKQTIQGEIKKLVLFTTKNRVQLSPEAQQSINDIEEVLSY
jgi:hypothetical protein